MKMRFVGFHKLLNGRRKWAVSGLLFACALPVGLSGSDEDAQKPPAQVVVPQQATPARLPSADLAATVGKPGQVPFLSNVTTSSEDGNLVVSVSTSGPVEAKKFLLSNPPRLVVDLVDVENRAPFFNLPIDAVGVKKLRIRQFQNESPRITRLVFDLEEEYGKYQMQSQGGDLKIVFQPRTDVTSEPKPESPNPAQPQAPEPAARPVETNAPTAEEKAAVVPVIRDLAASEIPRSALTVALAEPKPAPAREAAPPPPAPATPPRTAAPSVALPVGPADAKFTGHPLTLDLIDISLVDFFRLMAEEGGINIVMDPEITGTLSIKVVKVPWDQIFEAALINNALDRQIEGNLVRIAKKSTLQEEAKQREALKKATLLAADLETRIKRLNYAKATAFLASLTEQKTVRGTVVVDERSNSVILTDIPSSLERMVQLVETLDIPQPQVEIEARIVSATRDFARDIGIQFGFVQGNLERVTLGGPNTFGTIGGTRPAATPVNTYAAGNPVTGRGASESTSSQSAGVSTGNNNAGNFNLNLPSQKPFGGLGISVGNIFDTFLLDAAITAGESKGLAKLISQPKVTAQNNAQAIITQGLRFPVQIIANNTITVQFQNAALTLTVTPQITYEGNIVLDLKVENNTPDFARQVNGIPSIRTSESATRVLVSDGGTTVIGGILIDNETTQEDRVPGLASLPLIGNVFRRTAVSHNIQEVLFFITPRVIK
jgi:type IV pilus assembly protein PilQ